MDNFVIEFANKFPQYVDHFDNGKPVFNEIGSISLSFALMEIYHSIFSIIAFKEV